MRLVAGCKRDAGMNAGATQEFERGSVKAGPYTSAERHRATAHTVALA